jgi:glycosyltransferase involved in cell wall biosynthesis
MWTNTECIVIAVISKDSALLKCRPIDARLAKVFLMIGRLGLGGSEKQVVLIAEGLRGRGIDARVLVMGDGGAREDGLRAAGVPVINLGFRTWRDGAPKMLAANVAASWRLFRYLRRDRPEVLHAFLFHSYIAAAPAARLTRVPVLVAGRRSLGDFKEGRRALLALERIATRWTDLLIANAEAVAADTRRREGVPEEKIVVVHNGLPAAAFRPAEPASITTDLPVVLCVANIRPYKGHDHLFHAVARLRAHRPCTLVLAGDGVERPALQQRARRLGIDARFLGARTDIESLLARADVMVLPSLHEGLSNAVMEAMAAGVPVVATDVGGNRELLDGRGVLVPAADPAALADGLLRVLDDRVFAEELTDKAREWSRAHLMADVMVDRHVRIYQKLLEDACAG